jgi:cell division protein FtsQ
MRKILIILKWFTAIVLLIVVLSFTNERQKKQFVTLNDITVKQSDDNFINKKIVLEYLEKKHITFDSIVVAKFKKENLENLIQSHPGVKSVEVFNDQKGKVNIELEQKKAVVRIKSKLSDYYLDEFANKMQLSDNYTPRLLVLTGDVNEENHQSIFDFVTEINNSEFWNAQLTQIHFINNDVILIPRVGNQKINFGKLENTTEKLYNLYQFYKIAMPVKGWQTYSDINLKFNNQIVCTKNK